MKYGGKGHSRCHTWQESVADFVSIVHNLIYMFIVWTIQSLFYGRKTLYGSVYFHTIFQTKIKTTKGRAISLTGEPRSFGGENVTKFHGKHV